jgi:hypothetical protein
VACRLASIDLPQLKKAFKNNGVNGPILLELNERVIMRDLLITNEIHIKRFALFRMLFMLDGLMLISQAAPRNQNFEPCSEYFS